MTHGSQLVAIRMALRGRGITLIQGPPGTGKTKTILGATIRPLPNDETHCDYCLMAPPTARLMRRPDDAPMTT